MGGQLGLTAFRVINFKGYNDTEMLALRPITLFVGPNNAGKSTLLRAIGFLQSPSVARQVDYRDPQRPLQVELNFENMPLTHWNQSWNETPPWARLSLVFIPANPPSQPPQAMIATPHPNTEGQITRGVNQISNQEPYNLIYPYGSKRKVIDFDQQVNRAVQIHVPGNLSNLYAKVDRVANPAHPSYDLYTEMCRETLGFVPTTFASDNGKMAGIYIDAFRTISLEDMGEGVASLVGLIVELCVAQDKIFLIEELENDVHPEALKRLLDIIVERSSRNQFILSTHSNIVVRHLGSVPDAAIYHVQMKLVDRVPTSRCEAVPPEVGPRSRLLESLGYALADFDLWDGWLLLEESSAERIIRDYLIRWFTPRLSSVRTLAVGGVSKIEPSFEDFRRLFAFTHLEDRYRGRAWVVADGDDVGIAAIHRLRETHSQHWPADRFRNWSVADFERFYPAEFASRVTSVLNMGDRRARRDAKKQLLEEVLAWISEDDARARSAFETSAQEVVQLLKNIDVLLHG